MATLLSHGNTEQSLSRKAVACISFPAPLPAPNPPSPAWESLSFAVPPVVIADDMHG